MQRIFNDFATYTLFSSVVCAPACTRICIYKVALVVIKKYVMRLFKTFLKHLNTVFYVIPSVICIQLIELGQE